jgi:hypothetical protein
MVPSAKKGGSFTIFMLIRNQAGTQFQTQSLRRSDRAKIHRTVQIMLTSDHGPDLIEQARDSRQGA